MVWVQRYFVTNLSEGMQRLGQYGTGLRIWYFNGLLLDAMETLYMGQRNLTL